MVNLITGLIAIVIIVAFLGNYAYKINAVPLWIIIVGILAMVIADFVGSTRKGENESGE